MQVLPHVSFALTLAPLAWTVVATDAAVLARILLKPENIFRAPLP